jgi:L-threonylcarbamoyladenylate synthase
VDCGIHHNDRATLGMLHYVKIIYLQLKSTALVHPPTFFAVLYLLSPPSIMLITQKPSDILEIFHNGGIFAYPTEAIFGLGCDPDNEEAVQRLLSIKKRPKEKGLILVASNFSQVEKYLKPLNESQKEFTKPSSTTYIFPALASTPKWLIGDFDSLAIRNSKHPLVRELCTILDSALVSTSANLSGLEPKKSAVDVAEQLGDSIDAILYGNTGDSQNPSVIRDSITRQIIRP